MSSELENITHKKCTSGPFAGNPDCKSIWCSAMVYLK